MRKVVKTPTPSRAHISLGITSKTGISIFYFDMLNALRKFAATTILAFMMMIRKSSPWIFTTFGVVSRTRTASGSSIFTVLNVIIVTKLLQLGEKWPGKIGFVIIVKGNLTPSYS